MATTASLTSVSKKPTGLTIERNGYKFKCHWNKGESSYTAQQFQFMSKTTWLTPTGGITASATEKEITLSASGHYPNNSNKIDQFNFRVRGKKSGEWSSWVQKSFSIGAPPKPSVSATPSGSNVCTFAWSVAVDPSDHYPFYDVVYQTILVPNCNTTDGASLNWSSGQTGWQTSTGSAEGSISITESNVGTGSFTRWFRVMSRGMYGDSEWSYTSRIYASPATASNVTTTPTQTNAGGTDVYVGWDAQETISNPISEVVAQYTIVTPTAGLNCPIGATWNDSNIAADTSGADSALLKIDAQAGEDECLFVRINTVYGERITYGVAQLTKIGYLKAPTLTSVTPNYTNHSVVFVVSNQTTVPTAYINCFYRTASNPSSANFLGSIPNGTSSGTFTLPDLSSESSVEFGIRAVVVGGGHQMLSADVVTSSSVPTAPTSLTLDLTDISGTISAKWAWTWAAATGLELSWSDHKDAWYSTDEPSTFKVSDTRATEWRISGLETGKCWYVRVRLVQETEDTTVYSPWSDLKEIDLSSAPLRPVIALAQGVVPITGDVTAYWTYTTGDGTNQVYAEICEAEVSGGTVTYGDIIAHTQSAQQITIPASTWTAGTTHFLCVRTLSGSNHKSEWSAPAAVAIAEPLTAVIDATSLVSGELTALPFTATIEGAGAGGITTLTIERAEDYHVDRPTDVDFKGYKGETIANVVQTGEDEISVTQDMLYGSFDNGAQYRLIATVQDGLGQTDSVELQFVVNWAHKAGVPTGEVTMVDTVAKIKATAPSNYVSGDTCDIYRLSSDLPELVVKGAEFGTWYVDPYPAIGGGYRFVTVTANGDYITSDSTFAWDDVDSNFTHDHALIDFDGIQIPLYYNLDLSNSWEKDFQHTRYLGGSVRGDWNEGVYRTASLSTVAFTEYNAEVINKLRILAEYTGICNIRTLDGSSFKANIEVKEERDHGDYGVKTRFSMTIERIDPKELDGITYEMWL